MTSLLVVIDVQNGFVNSNSEHIVSPLAAFLREWLDLGRRVVLTRFHNPVGSKWETLIHWSRLREGTEIEFAPEVAKIVVAYSGGGLLTIVDKSTYTSLIAPTLEIIKNFDVRDVYLCGIATDGCVLKTAIDVFETGKLRPFLLTDLCASHAGPTIHQAGLELASRFIGRDQLIESTLSL